jgi:hypothetical protein
MSWLNEALAQAREEKRRLFGEANNHPNITILNNEPTFPFLIKIGPILHHYLTFEEAVQVRDELDFAIDEYIRGNDETM